MVRFREPQPQVVENLNKFTQQDKCLSNKYCAHPRNPWSACQICNIVHSIELEVSKINILRSNNAADAASTVHTASHTYFLKGMAKNHITFTTF